MEMNFFICIFNALVWFHVEVILSSQEKSLGSGSIKQGKGQPETSPLYYKAIKWSEVYEENYHRA